MSMKILFGIHLTLTLLFFKKAQNQGELDVYDNKDGKFYKIYPFSLNDLTN